MQEKKAPKMGKKKIKVCTSILIISVIIAFGIYLIPNKNLAEERKVDFSGCNRNL